MNADKKVVRSAFIRVHLRPNQFLERVHLLYEEANIHFSVLDTGGTKNPGCAPIRWPEKLSRNLIWPPINTDQNKKVLSVSIGVYRWPIYFFSITLPPIPKHRPWRAHCGFGLPWTAQGSGLAES
jgi:hypothetical protein